METEVDNLRRQLEESERKRTSLKQEYATLLAKYSVDSGAALRANTTNSLTVERRLLQNFNTLPPVLRDIYADSLPALSAHSESVLRAVSTLDTQIQLVRSRESEEKLILDEIARLETQRNSEDAENSRLSNALQALKALQLDHSRDAALESFLRSNTQSIERIFSQIHSPQELRLKDPTECRLERTETHEAVTLAEISTGQRAAFVLSVFLTLNLSLRRGPRLMLIDDPVAHIDDLNALSFLDFLADVAQSGQQQIFFATASEKLANLFEKKMAFLEKDFAVHRLC